MPKSKRKERNNPKEWQLLLQSRQTTNTLLAFLVVMAIWYILRTAQAILVPVFVACFLTMAIQPVMRWLRRFLPRWLSLSVVLILVSVVMVTASLLFTMNIWEITAKKGYYLKRFQSTTAGLLALAGKYNIHLTWEQLGTRKSLEWMLSFVSSGISSMLGILAQTVLVLFLTIFLEFEHSAFRRKLEKSFPGERFLMIEETLVSVTVKIQHYLLTKTAISFVTGAFTGLFTYWIGLDFYLFWGMLAFLLNYIPNVGSTIAIIPPIILAFIQFDGATRGVLTLFGLGGIQTLMGYILEPRSMGESLEISPVVVLLSTVLWGWMWGIVGAVLAVPLTVGIKILCEHIESLRPVAILLGSDPKESIVHMEEIST